MPAPCRPPPPRGTGSTGAATARPTRGAHQRPQRHLLRAEPERPGDRPGGRSDRDGASPSERPAAHPSGAASAALIAIRCHSAGISPGRCRARATASEAPRPTAPATAPAAAALAPLWPASDAPAKPPIAHGEADRSRPVRRRGAASSSHPGNLPSGRVAVPHQAREANRALTRRAASRPTGDPGQDTAPQRLEARMSWPSRPGSSARTAPRTVATTMMNALADSQPYSVNATPRNPYCCWLLATRVGR